jgi:hypothetical protein
VTNHDDAVVASCPLLPEPKDENMNLWKTSTIVLTGALAALIGYGSITSAHADPQPKMQAALAALESAKASLDAATSDKGGHRVKAIQATKDAIEETKKGIAYDSAHESKDEKKKESK